MHSNRKSMHVVRRAYSECSFVKEAYSQGPRAGRDARAGRPLGLSNSRATGWQQGDIKRRACASRGVCESCLPRWTSKVSPSASPLRSRFHGRGNRHGSGAARGGAIRRRAPPRHPPGGAWPNPRGRLFARLYRRAPAALGEVVRDAAASLSRERPSQPQRLRSGRRASRPAGAGSTRQRRCRRPLPGQAARRRAVGPYAAAIDRRSALFAASARGTLRRRRRLCGAATAPLPPAVGSCRLSMARPRQRALGAPSSDDEVDDDPDSDGRTDPSVWR